MTTQTILVIAGIVAVFAVFGIGLASADFYTGRARKPRIAAPPVPAERRHEPAEQRRAA